MYVCSGICLSAYQYYRLLHAFPTRRSSDLNFRTLLKDVTLHPAMGLYLNMLRNDKANSVLGTRPNENYAREIMQLFSVDRKSTHQNSSHVRISYAVFCLKKKNGNTRIDDGH